jgi:lysocardiolipin and lysophospholipid acyltransferase
VLILTWRSTFVTQLVGAPLYFVNKEWYYAYMAMTKQNFALITSFMTNVWGPTTVRISGDESVAGQIHGTEDGHVQFDFPERMVLVANHQVCLEAGL